MGMVQSCTKRGSDRTLGSISLPKGQSDTAAWFLERWSMPQDSQVFKRHLAMPLIKHFNFWSDLNLSVIWTR